MGTMVPSYDSGSSAATTTARATTRGTSARGRPDLFGPASFTRRQAGVRLGRTAERPNGLEGLRTGVAGLSTPEYSQLHTN